MHEYRNQAVRVVVSATTTFNISLGTNVLPKGQGQKIMKPTRVSVIPLEAPSLHVKICPGQIGIIRRS